MILVDTNVLARLPSTRDPLRETARVSLIHMMRRGEQLVVAPQCLFEFWVVATRSLKENGLGFSSNRTSKWLHHIKHLCMLLPERESVYERWETLIKAFDVNGKKGHDAHLVAWMQVHDVQSILTFNVGDFSRFGIRVVDPKLLPLLPS